MRLDSGHYCLINSTQCTKQFLTGGGGECPHCPMSATPLATSIYQQFLGRINVGYASKHKSKFFSIKVVISDEIIFSVNFKIFISFTKQFFTFYTIRVECEELFCKTK